MQMTPSPIKRDNTDLNMLITGIGNTNDLSLQTFEVKKLCCISQVRRYLRLLQGAF